MSDPRHFITGTELTDRELGTVVERALELKSVGPAGPRPLRDRSIALLFEKPSTRTRVSFQVGISQLGGHVLLLRSEELQLARGESVKDTALVLSRYIDAIAGRVGEHAVLEELAEYASVPVVNALTPLHHPCQALADLLTLRERFGRTEGLRVAYVGDGNNVCHSLMLLGARAGVEVVAATPAELRPDDAIVAEAGDLARSWRIRPRRLRERMLCTPMCGSAWGTSPSPHPGASCWSPTGSTPPSWHTPVTTPS